MSQITSPHLQNDKIQAANDQMSQFPRQKSPPEGKSTTTPILQNDQQKGADETATEQELPPLHSAYLTLFDVTTLPCPTRYQLQFPN
jgi:hypothetical protein